MDAAGAGGANSGGMPTVEPFVPKFVTGHSGGSRVTLITREGALLWSIDVGGEANDAWLLPSGNIVFAFKTGAREVTPAKALVWEYKAASNGETHSCQPLEGGGFLVGESRDGGTQSALHELNSSGEIQLTIPLGGLATGNRHAQFRQVRKTPQGTYLVGYGGPARTVEVDQAGKVLRTFPLGQFTAVRLPNGNTLISGGDDPRKVVEYNNSGDVVWELGASSLTGHTLVHVPGIQRLANGNTVVTNWGGHAAGFDQAHILEVTPDKQVVWFFKEPDLTGPVSNVHVVDSAADLGGSALR